MMARSASAPRARRGRWRGGGTAPQPTNFATAFSWGQDFWRAFRERPRALRWIAFACMGRYASRELIGMRDAIEKEGYSTRWPYDDVLQGMGYHQEKVNKWL